MVKFHHGLLAAQSGPQRLWPQPTASCDDLARTGDDGGVAIVPKPARQPHHGTYQQPGEEGTA